MRMRPRTLALLCVAILTLAVLAAVSVRAAVSGLAATGPAPETSGSATPGGSPTTGRSANVAPQSAPPAPDLVLPADPSRITAPGTNFFGWTLIDRPTGQSSGSANQQSATSTTESMIKAWIAADYLRHQTTAPSSATLAELTTMIIDSDNNMATKYYRLNGGDPSITELVKLCGLTNTKMPYLANEWSYTTMSPADAARMGLCIANGTAAGPRWTNWLLDTMKHVRGTVDQQQVSTGGGHWGIIDGLPANVVPDASIKNGWTAQVYDHNWHINCLAITPNWVLAIELQYPWTSPNGDWQQANNLQQGADTCASVTRQLVGLPQG
jgi:hypothetical protein